MRDTVMSILGLSGEDQSGLIDSLIDLVSKRLLAMLGPDVSEVPEQLSYIVTEVTIARFNRIGSEGLSSHSVEGETQSWSQDDFAPYMDDIRNWLNSRAADGEGRVKFL